MNASLVLGATKGLGRQLSDLLRARGQTVLGVGRSATPADRFVPLRYDLGDESSTRRLIAELDERLSVGLVIDEFFWVSGLLHRAPFGKIDRGHVSEMIEVNLKQPLFVAQRVWNHLQRQAQPSRFVVISSTTGVSDSPREDEAIYAATKAAQVSFARAIGKNNTSTKTRVALFCPGGMKTDLWNDNAIDPATFASFMDPKNVAAKIMSELDRQREPYAELVIPRGSV